MNYIVFDMEWNQPRNLREEIKSPVVLHGEIIQIGAVKLDENYNIVNTYKTMVAPKHYTKMHEKVARITGINTKDLKFGLPFAHAIKDFRKWCGEDYVFLSWGDEDEYILRENLIIYNMDEGWIPKVYDLQVIFDKQITNENRQVSLVDAVNICGEKPCIAHDALNDAKNTVRVCAHLDLEKGVREYDDESQIRWHKSPISEMYGYEKRYLTEKDALEDKTVTNFYCPTFESNVVCREVIKQENNKYICFGQSDNGKELFVRFNMRKEKDGKYSVVRLIYKITELTKDYFTDYFADVKAKAQHLEA